jgi:hypothetical protein
MMAPHSGEAALRSSSTFLAQSSQELFLFFCSIHSISLPPTFIFIHPSSIHINIYSHPRHQYSTPLPTMRTAVILTGVAALAAAAPAVVSPKDAVTGVPINGGQDGDWYVVPTTPHLSLH